MKVRGTRRPGWRGPEKLLKVLGSLFEGGTLTRKETDALEAAIEDELIAMRVGGLLSGH